MTLGNEQFLQRVLLANPAAILVYDYERDQMIYASGAALETLGMSSDGLIQKEGIIERLIHEEDQEQWVKLSHDLQGSKGADCLERVLRFGDSKSGWIWLRLRAVPFERDSKGKVVQALFSAEDVTAWKRDEEKLQEALRKLNLLTWVTKHDAMNQLITATGYLDLQLRKTNEEASAAQLKKVRLALVKVKEQIDFMADYGALGSSPPTWQSLGRVMDSLREGSEFERLDVSADASEIQVLADPMFPKVFRNLLENSVLHGEHADKIEIGCREVSDGLLIWYADNGVGIPESDKKRIFEKGFGKHTGLGLFLVREILAITGIEIYENGEPGKGARFEMHVPNGAYELKQ